ncbi:hypothetical protein FSP39_006854 [Pinctada imbricata]|uniref:Leucine-rich repeat and IQ domain-containing protein 1 n=1 Tax=Pinctada imbricata TaxID=66713 RepID=A0AA88YHL8_PINIB|nr:hypothetical protein FSP39_006854 [Pinctada imbricata]
MKEEKKKKEEEKRRAEEEAKRKEEERKREEAEKKRIEEEKRKEELKKKLEEEERRKAEEEEINRQEEERKKIEEEERQRREAEEKLRIEKEELLKEKQIKDEGFRQPSEREEVLNDKTNENGQRQEFSEHNDTKLNGSARDKTFVSKSSKRKVEKTFVVDNGAMDNGASDEEFLDTNEEDKIRNKAVNGMIEGLPDSLEKKRLQWIKDCTPWSKVSNEPWKLKPASSKRAVRRPSSAKKLSPLNEKLILSAAHAATLRQVTTVELHDLPGCSVTPLGQCWGLKHLTMTNCNLTVIEGLQQCKQLQYVNLKDNRIEYVDIKDLGNISYVNLCSNNLSVIHGLSGCTNIRWLDLSHNKITRLGGLDSLRRIHTLILSHNQLISTSCLSDTPTIQYLDISNNHLQKIEDIEKLCLLQTLKASSNNLLELLSLENNVLLQELIVDDNSISSMNTLQTAWLPLLHTLNISQNSLEDLISLEQFHVLKHLDISTNQILEPDQIIESISGCAYLESLNVSGNPAIEDSQLQLSDKYPRLSSVDHNSVRKSHDLDTPIKPHNSFQAMCLTQIQFFRDMYLKFIQEVKQSESKSPIDVSVLCDTYFKFCDKSHKVACDHRYAHEYGDIAMAMPVAPSTPKSGRPRSSRSAKLIQKDDAYQNPKDLFNKAAGAQSINNSSRSFEKYSDPKDLFEKAVSSENSKNSSQRNYVNGGIVNEEEVSGRNGLRSEKTVVITAKTVKDLIEKDPSVRDESVIRHAAATKIQAHWRGYSLRKYLYGDHEDDFHGDQADFDSDMAVLQQLHKAATKIQAVWRGYILRLRLERAIEFARLEDDDEDFLEVDLDDFNFNEDVLDDWRPPTTPQIPSAHPVLGKPPSGKQGSPPGKVPPLHLKEKNLPPVKPQRAWRGAESPLSDIHQNGHMPRPPPSVMSGTDTHRTVNSKKEEKLSEEWGFKDTNTAHLMMQRAKKMKYNSERRKKLSKLDPKQRLALFRRLEETGTVRKPQYVQPSKQTLPRKEYFQARQEEIERKDLEKRVMHNFKNNRTYEWIHTQVGDYEVSDSAITHKNPVARGRYGSEGNLPRMDPDVTAGRPPRLVASPSLDVQSVDSVSLQGEMAQPRRFSAGSEGTGRFPPIKTSSAGSTNSQGSRKRERMSWRNKEVNKSIGWGGGKKRGNLHE